MVPEEGEQVGSHLVGTRERLAAEGSSYAKLSTVSALYDTELLSTLTCIRKTGTAATSRDDMIQKAC